VSDPKDPEWLILLRAALAAEQEITLLTLRSVQVTYPWFEHVNGHRRRVTGWANGELRYVQSVIDHGAPGWVHSESDQVFATAEEAKAACDAIDREDGLIFLPGEPRRA
jgi:hypothetical protein